jgi:hypothetical protein
MYLFQFDLNIRHKSERKHIILDALSRLSFFDIKEKFAKKSDIDILSDIDAYVETLVEMSSLFKNRLIEDYKTNKQ